MATATAQETVLCAFCNGRGTDPYDQLSSRSKCGSCDGAGTKVVSSPHTTCAFCRGSGSHKTFRCPICGGAGAVPVLDGPTETCPECEGLAAETSSGLPCLRCRGRGVIRRADHISVHHDRRSE